MKSLLNIFFLLCILGVSQSQDLATLNASIVQLNKSFSSISWISGASALQFANDGVNNFNYMYRDAVVYQDIFAAYQTRVFEKRGAPAGWDETTYSSTLFLGRKILKIGAGVQASNANGIVVHVPSGYNVLWLRVLSDRWETFRVMSAVYTETQQAIYAGGFRNLNEISPDGGSADSYNLYHMWLPIPLYFPGDYFVFSDANSDDWISGIAYGKNLWNHAMNAAVAYSWFLNGGTGVTFESANWNNDVLSKLLPGIINQLYVPVVPSGKNKLLYFVEHNSNWVGTMHGGVRVNDYDIERLRTSYHNPFATHHSSKFYQRYVAALVPANIFANTAKFLKVEIDMTMSDTAFYFREVGTHDYI